MAVGEDPDREGLLETPARVARMYAEVFAGLHADPAVHLKKTFTQPHDEMVLVKDIEFASSAANTTWSRSWARRTSPTCRTARWSA